MTDEKIIRVFTIFLTFVVIMELSAFISDLI